MVSKITDKSMQAKPTEVDQWLHERFERGAGVFAARITTAGERIFYFRYTDSAGRRPYLKLGVYHQRGVGGLSVEQARSLARERSDLYRQGVVDLHSHFAIMAEAAKISAQVERTKAENEKQELEEQARLEAEARERRLTVRALFDRWQTTELIPRLRADGKRSGRKDGGLFTQQQFERRVFPKVGDVPACDVRKSAVMDILDAVKSEGKLRTANVLLADLKQMFRFAVSRDIVQQSPVEGVVKRDVGGSSVERERVLKEDEIKALALALPKANLGFRTEAAIWIVLSTCVRAGELVGAVWANQSTDVTELQERADHAGAKLGFLDLASRTWHIPTTKNQREHTIHLSNFAVQQFEKLLAGRDLSPWVFPNTAGTGPVSVKSFGKQISDRQRAPERRMSNRTIKTDSLVLAGGNWTTHDLRRTGATLMAQLGVSNDVIEECLNHKIAGRVTRVYVRDRREMQQAAALDTLGGLLLQLTDNKQSRTQRNEREHDPHH